MQTYIAQQMRFGGWSVYKFNLYLNDYVFLMRCVSEVSALETARELNADISDYPCLR